MSSLPDALHKMLRSSMASCLGCLWPEKSSTERSGSLSPLGVEREMKIYHNQPHLIPPMRLVVYDDIPPSPTQKSSSHVSQFVSRGRSLASRASDRASLTIRKRSSSRPTIGAPTSFRRVEPPRRRLEPFRPLELSIYQDGNRLSDLPEFDAIDFNAIGEIQIPRRAFIRAKSENFVARTSTFRVPRKPAASLVDGRALGHWQRSLPQFTSDTDAPLGPQEQSVIWDSLPGLPSDLKLSTVSENSSTPWPRSTHRPESNNTELTFPIPYSEPSPSNGSFFDRAPNSSRNTPSRYVHPEPLRSHSICVDEFSLPPSTPPNRVTQWLSHHNSSPVIPASTTLPAYNAATTTKRAQIYNLTSSPPRSSHNRTRTRTISISTVSSTTVFSRADSFSSMTSMTTAPTLKSSRARPTIQQRGDSLPPSRSGKDTPSILEHPITVEPVLAPREAPTQPCVGVAF